MFQRVISLVSENKVYHKPGCPYIAKIHKDYRKCVDIDDPKFKRYRACKYCGGVRGWAKVFHKRPGRRKEEERMRCWYDEEWNDLYIKTWCGFWKLRWFEKDQHFGLYHRNQFDPELSDFELMKGPFHRQKDMNSHPQFDSLVHYIFQHDRDKEIAADDYRKLPQQTKKQKQYFRHHKKMAEKAKRKRLDELFKQIESKSRN